MQIKSSEDNQSVKKVYEELLKNDKKYSDYKINNINYEIDETFREFYE